MEVERAKVLRSAETRAFGGAGAVNPFFKAKPSACKKRTADPCSLPDAARVGASKWARGDAPPASQLRSVGSDPSVYRLRILRSVFQSG